MSTNGKMAIDEVASVADAVFLAATGLRRGTVRFIPSGVTSSAQARNNATGKPRISNQRTSDVDQAGRFNGSNVTSAICVSIQAPTT
jgi:hypothetical protein